MKVILRQIITVFLLLAALGVGAQDSILTYASRSTSADPPAVNREVADRAPTLLGTETDIRLWIADRIAYPELAQQYAVEGQVIVSYVIQADGRMTDVGIYKGLGFGCDKAALAVFAEMPRWKPAVRDGEAVAVRCLTPIAFSLR